MQSANISTSAQAFPTCATMRAMQTTKKPKKISTSDDAARPRRAVTQKTEKTVRGGASVKRAVAPRSQTSPKTDKSRISERNDGLKRSEPRKASKTVTAKGDSPRRAPAQKPGKAPVVAAKPRRTGTKLSRLLDLNVAPVKTPPPAARSHLDTGAGTALTHWLLYCRAGFEKDCAQEAVAQARAQRPVLAEQPATLVDSGYALVAINEQALDYRELIFARQLIRLEHIIEELPERDRLTPLLAAIAAIPGNFSALWLEVPDTNDGKTLSAFTRRFQPLLETALKEQGRLLDATNDSVRTEPVEAGTESAPFIHPSTRSGRTDKLQRLHIFFPDKTAALIGTSDPYNSSSSIMGIARQSIPSEAPSRSTLKLAEAIDVFLDKSEQTRLLRSGMTAVDLGAAPGGWTWQMVRRGIRVTAVDNGDMKGTMDKNPLVEHLRQDGFKYAPRKAVDWLICDMVEKPAKVAELVGNWFVSGWCKHAIFNLKLPMKQRVAALDAALNGIRSRLKMEGISYKLSAKQLYHDREEVTVFLSKTKNR
jgi:23S rRNA (cytidine2498-2'-O)-methyltransferase